MSCNPMQDVGFAHTFAGFASESTMKVSPLQRYISLAAWCVLLAGCDMAHLLLPCRHGFKGSPVSCGEYQHSSPCSCST